MKVMHNKQRHFFPVVLALCAVFAPAQTTLLSNVRLSSETIRLSDLLPQIASPELRGRAKNVDLGRAPQLGAIRVLQHDQIAEVLKAHPEIDTRLSIPDQIIVIRSGYPLDLSDIRQQVNRFVPENVGLTDFPDSALDWPRHIATSSSHPTLRVRSAHWDTFQQRLLLLMRCAPASACAEFLVSLRPPKSLIGNGQRQPGGLAISSTSQEVAATSNAPILIPSGHKAWLVLQSNGMQISLQVISLENGREGETIRVRESGSSRIFRVQVVNCDLLWGRLES